MAPAAGRHRLHAVPGPPALPAEARHAAEGDDAIPAGSVRDAGRARRRHAALPRARRIPPALHRRRFNTLGERRLQVPSAPDATTTSAAALRTDSTTCSPEPRMGQAHLARDPTFFQRLSPANEIPVDRLLDFARAGQPGRRPRAGRGSSTATSPTWSLQYRPQLPVGDPVRGRRAAVEHILVVGHYAAGGVHAAPTWARVACRQLDPPRRRRRRRSTPGCWPAQARNRCSTTACAS